MKLVAKLEEAIVEGGKAIVVYTDAGEMLPNQVGTIFSAHLLEGSELTIRFRVDGDNIVVQG